MSFESASSALVLFCVYVPLLHRGNIVSLYPVYICSFTLAWKSQPRVQGRFVSCAQADTVTPTTYTVSAEADSSFPSSPTSESSVTSSENQRSEDDTPESQFADESYHNISPLRTPVNTPLPLPPPSPKPSPFMQLENIPESSGTQEDKNQPTDFLKAIKRAF